MPFPDGQAGGFPSTSTFSDGGLPIALRAGDRVQGYPWATSPTGHLLLLLLLLLL